MKKVSLKCATLLIADNYERSHVTLWRVTIDVFHRINAINTPVRLLDSRVSATSMTSVGLCLSNHSLLQNACFSTTDQAHLY